jgi:hypothetical protein
LPVRYKKIRLLVMDSRAGALTSDARTLLLGPGTAGAIALQSN